MKAFVLCGGEGTRLRPYTYKTPKPMLKVGGKPILQFVIENLRANGITDIVMTVGYLRNQITDYFGNGSKFGVNIKYAEETSPKNTAGSILDFKGKVKETFVVTMGDHIAEIDFRKMIELHKKKKNIATIALKKHRTKIEYGVVELNDNEVNNFVEKPVFENFINTAIYIFEPKIFDYIMEREDFAKDVFPRLLKSGQKITAYKFDGHWFDIGRVSEYDKIKDLKSVSLNSIAELLETK
ncbi:nucleotidyltransferase family protein [Candidatus Micrarchaeota archaeon]|nr:nucleotidyltransferase family protein [Candidatus Micrarchaeota archaeon]